jgi:hypothetical protein
MIRAMMAAFCLCGTLMAQAGHWEGTVQTPGGDLAIEIDLAQSGGGWIGTISIPAQNTKGLALIDVQVKDNVVTFGIKAPGDPRIRGTVAKDGGTMGAELTQSGMNMAFSLKRTGEAKIEKPVQNPSLSTDLEGTWEGTLDAGGRTLRLRFVLSNQAGAGTGAIVSLDQGNVEIPIAKISRTDAKVTMDVPVVGGGFVGELKDGKLSGQWSQGGGSLPLTLTKAAK